MSSLLKRLNQDLPACGLGLEDEQLVILARCIVRDCRVVPAKSFRDVPRLSDDDAYFIVICALLEIREQQKQPAATLHLYRLAARCNITSEYYRLMRQRKVIDGATFSNDRQPNVYPKPQKHEPIYSDRSEDVITAQQVLSYIQRMYPDKFGMVLRWMDDKSHNDSERRVAERFLYDLRNHPL